MKFAYADPPYLGSCARYDHHHPDGRCWDDVQTHRRLIERLREEYPDGWAVSCTPGNLYAYLPRFSVGAAAENGLPRIAAWVKPFAVFKPNVNPAYAWEAVLFTGGRPFTREDETVRDWHSEGITLKRGLVGAKPAGFARWIARLLNVRPDLGDTIDDLYPGTGGMREAWDQHELRSLTPERTDR